MLQSTILKVAHHGSKSSSIQEFLNVVKPKIALIGVGRKNTFGLQIMGFRKLMGSKVKYIGQINVAKL